MKFAKLIVLAATFSIHAQAQTPTVEKLSKDIDDLKKIVSIQQSQLDKFDKSIQDKVDQKIGGGLRICSGTTQGNANWIVYGEKGITLNIDTSSCKFTETPKYFTNFSGTTSHWMTSGATSIYTPTPTGFSVYIYFHFDNSDWLAYAKSANWNIEWMAIGK